MKIRVLGFEPDYKVLPKPVAVTAGFEWLRAHPGSALTSVLIGAVTPVEDWLVGLLVKSRDAKTLTKMRQQGGISIIKAEKLPAGEKLTETNFFLAHPQTGRGLYAHHHASASMTADFGRVCAKIFNLQRKALLEVAIAKPDLTGKQIAALRKEYRGQFSLNKVLSRGLLADFLKEMKHVSSFESTFTSFDLEEELFDPLSKLARRKMVRFQFPPDLAMELIDDDILDAVDSGNLDDFKVSAYDQRGELNRFRSAQNALVFEEYDYDDLLGTVDISFDNWPDSIANSEATKKLVGLAKSSRIGKMLEAPC